MFSALGDTSLRPAVDAWSRTDQWPCDHRVKTHTGTLLMLVVLYQVPFLFTYIVCSFGYCIYLPIRTHMIVMRIDMAYSPN